MFDAATNPFLGIYLCVHDQHQPEMVALAAAVIGMTGVTVLLSLRRARILSGRKRMMWGCLAGASLGIGEWATHYVALLGYIASVPINFDLTVTIFSMLVAGATGVATAAILLSHRLPSSIRLAIASLVHGGGLATMHYTGVAGLDIPARLQWDAGLIVSSTFIAMAMSYPTFLLALKGRGQRSLFGSVICLTVLVAATHMVGMTALRIIPTGVLHDGITLTAGDIAGWIVIAVTAIGSCGLVVVLANRHGRKALEQSEKQFLLLMKATSDYAICMLDTDGYISQWNVGAERLTGYASCEAIGMPMASFYREEDRERGLADKAIQIARAKGLCIQDGLCRRRDGSHFWAHGTLEQLTDEHGVDVGFSLIMRDVSQFKNAQDLLAETSKHLDSALENMHEGLCLFDANERIVLSNRRFRELWSIDIGVCKPGTSLGTLIVQGFMNSGGVEHAPHQLWQFRQLLDDASSTGRGAPTVIEFGHQRVISIANKRLPGGGWVTTCTDVTEQRRSEAKIEHMALHDSLTGLANRTRFYISLDEAVGRARAHDLKVAVVAIDLDRFKDINDTQGHAAGDRLLRTVALRMSQSCVDDEMVARLGGDEFAAYKIYRDAAEIDEFIARMRTCVIEPLHEIDQHLTINASVGVAIYPLDGTDHETLLNNADLAMHRAKSTIGGSVCFFEQNMDEAARQRRQIANDLRHAIDRGEMTLVYQPQRSLRTDSVTGYEALLRWHHPIKGLISPAEFIPIAEETGAILAIGEWALREACREANGWPSPCKVAVNLSSVQFLQDGLVEQVRSILVETGLSPRRLELEITETAIISDKQRALHCLRQFKAAGISIAIDDFGTGYSSLDTLHSFPFDRIKIDKSFLGCAESNMQGRAIIRAILALGKSLHVPVLAEGVETERQLWFLRSEGCEEAQGYYFGYPGAVPGLDIPLTVNG